MTARRGPNLFEVMSKAPQARAQPRRRKWFGRRPSTLAGAAPVAEALTEEEAARAMAEQRAREDEARRRRERRAEEKRARAEARAAARAAVKLAKIEARQRARAERRERITQPPVRLDGPTPVVKLSTPVIVVAAAFVVVVGLLGYRLGRGTSPETARLSPVAAVGTDPASRSPLLGNERDDGARRPAPSPKQAAARPINASPRRSGDAQAAGNPSISVNRPVGVPDTAPPGAATDKRLNYVQIESFMISRDRNGVQVARDVAHARAFLRDRGIGTFARRRSNGYVLYAQQGFLPGPEHRKARADFLRRIESLGQEYLKSGGLYQFKGCLFVSHAATRVGDPV